MSSAHRWLSGGAGPSRVWRAALVVLLASALAAPSASAQSDVEDLNKQALAKSKAGDLDGAVADYTRILTIDPSNARAYHERGVAKHRKRDFDGAISDYTQAIEINPKYVLAYNSRGYARRSKGDVDGAIADYTQAIAIDSGNVYAYSSRGIAKRGKGDFEGAFADLTSAIGLDPRRAATYNDRGIALQARGDYDSALADYAMAIAIDPRFALAYNNLGWLLATAKEPKVRDGRRALEAATKACELTQWKEPTFLDTLAAAYARSGDFAHAIVWQQKALEDRAGGPQMLERLWLYRRGAAWPLD